MIFQIWDTETANMVGAFSSAGAALHAIREAVDNHDEPYIAAWALEYEDDEGHIETIGEGIALLSDELKHISA